MSLLDNYLDPDTESDKRDFADDVCDIVGKLFITMNYNLTLYQYS